MEIAWIKEKQNIFSLIFLLSISILAYLLIFSTVSILNFQLFGMSAYDIGIHDQAIWKLSENEGFFNTIRGLPIFGDHCWFILFFMAPVYWVAPKIESILIIQSLALSAAAIPLALITYRKTKNTYVTIMLSWAWLLSPALQNMNLENFHPEVISTFFLLFSIERAYARDWKLYSLMIALCLLSKENIAITTFFIGFWLLVSQKEKKAGLLTMIISLVWFLFCLKIILPFFNGEGFFRFKGGYWFSQFWNQKFEIAYYFETIFNKTVGTYFFRLGFPLLFLFVFEPLLTLCAIPSFIINCLSGNGYLISIDYHYNHQTLPILFAATASAIARLKALIPKGHIFIYIAASCILASSLLANNKWSHLPLSKTYREISSKLNQYENSTKRQNFKKLYSYLPKDPKTPISVSHNIVPHLTHRTEIYMFPNPFRHMYWGIRGENLPSPDRVDALFIDKSTMDANSLLLFDMLIKKNNFAIVDRAGDIIVALRISQQTKTLDTEIKNNIFIEAYHFSKTVTSIIPINGVSPNLEVKTKALFIPETMNELRTIEGISLGGRDNMRLRLNGIWMARGENSMVFRLRADDGCKIYLDGKILIDYAGVHSTSDSIKSKVLQLSNGWHDIVVDYFEWGGNAGLSLEWSKYSEETKLKFRPLIAGEALP